MNAKPLTALLLALPLAGCGLDFSAKYPDRKFHDIDVTRPGARGEVVTGTVLKVRRFRVSPRYEGVELVTRRNDLQFESDFYNVFFVPPSSMITDEVRRWMAGAGPFEHVLDFSSHLDATHVLEASVSALRGDVIDGAAPKAVLEIEFFLIDDRAVPPSIAFRKDYKRESPLKDEGADAMVRGWTEGLTQIMTEFEADLRQVKLK